MEHEWRKRKRRYRPYSHVHYLSVRSLILCLSFFVFLFFLSSDWFDVSTTSLRPVLRVPSLSVLSMDSIQLSFRKKLPPLRVEDRVQFPDHLLLVVSSKIRSSDKLHCVYYRVDDSSGDFSTEKDVFIKPVISIDSYGGFRSIGRCTNAPLNYLSTVDLQRHGDVRKLSNFASRVRNSNHTVHNWDRVVYDAVVDGDTVVVFVKGLNLRPHRESDPSYYKCQFGTGNLEFDEGFLFETEAVTAAQEIIRCKLPRSIRMNPGRAQGIGVGVVHVNPNEREPRVHDSESNLRRRRQNRKQDHVRVPSVARISDFNSYEKRIGKGKFELCVCTMLWNQASFLPEWIMYHAWLGVERWFIYDNNSDDEIQDVIEELELQNYNVTRHAWPWIKTQEAGFSHCALRAKKECKWVGFFDVDEFFYFPSRHKRGLPGRNSLRSLVANFSSSKTVGEIRTDCHSFGPSGLTSRPSQGVTMGYTCRLQSPERHKSIVRPDLLSHSLLNEVHHFQLREGFRHLNLLESTAVVNHYKYQVWDTFKAKFYRRVATYVVDWQENQNQGSKDRAPGLGTEAIEPPDWRRRFCEVWDTGLKDLVLSNFADPATGHLPWKRALPR